MSEYSLIVTHEPGDLFTGLDEPGQHQQFYSRDWAWVCAAAKNAVADGYHVIISEVKDA